MLSVRRSELKEKDFYTSDAKLVKMYSEDLEPTAIYCLGRWFDRCQTALAVQQEIIIKCKMEGREKTFHEYLDCEEFYNNCSTMWYGLQALNKLSIACKTTTHFSLAVSGEMSRVAGYIKEHLGFNPILDKKGFGF